MERLARRVVLADGAGALDDELGARQLAREHRLHLAAARVVVPVELALVAAARDRLPLQRVEEGLPGWFGTFADMMTLLFAFFVLLAAISTIDPVKLQNMADSMGKSVGTKEEIDNQAMSLGDIHKAATKMVEEMG